MSKGFSSERLQRIEDLLKGFHVDAHINTVYYIEQILLLLKEQEETRLDDILRR